MTTGPPPVDFLLYFVARGCGSSTLIGLISLSSLFELTVLFEDRDLSNGSVTRTRPSLVNPVLSLRSWFL